MSIPEVRVIGISGLPQVTAGDDLGDLIVQAVRGVALEIENKDVFVVAQKVVSKAEGRIVSLDSVRPSFQARSWAETHGKDARRIEVVLAQTRRIVRMEKGILVVETKHGFVCANAGVDSSNVPGGVVTLLPKDPDLSAKRMRDSLERVFGVTLGIIISDTVGRPWREGIVNVALGVAGLSPFLDYHGQRDRFGRRLESTRIAVADELAAAAELVMGKTREIPVAVVRGFDYCEGEGSGREMIRPAEQDLFR